MEIIEKDKNRYGDEIILKKDTTTDIDPIYIITIEGKKVFETKNYERAEIKFFNVATSGC